MLARLYIACDVRPPTLPSLDSLTSSTSPEDLTLDMRSKTERAKVSRERVVAAGPDFRERRPVDRAQHFLRRPSRTIQSLRLFTTTSSSSRMGRSTSPQHRLQTRRERQASWSMQTKTKEPPFVPRLGRHLAPPPHNRSNASIPVCSQKIRPSYSINSNRNPSSVSRSGVCYATIAISARSQALTNLSSVHSHSIRLVVTNKCPIISSSIIQA